VKSFLPTLSFCARCTAKWTGLALNVALALQVLLGALTTALGAALSGKNVRMLPPLLSVP